MTCEALIELLYGLYSSGNVENKVIIHQTILVHLLSQVGYAILYFFNLLQEAASLLTLDALDKKNLGVSNILLEENLELLLDYW